MKNKYFRLTFVQDESVHQSRKLCVKFQLATVLNCFIVCIIVAEQLR